MKVYLINLKRHPDRLKRMMDILSQYAFLDIEIFSGTDGEFLNPLILNLNNIQILENWIDPYTHRTITKGEVGCAISHYRIWTMILKQSLTSGGAINEALILEDDVEMTSEFVNWVNIYYEELRNNASDYELVYLSRKKFGDDLGRVSKHIVRPCFSYWANAYLLTSKGAEKLIRGDFQRNIIPVDEYLPIQYLSNDLKAYAFDPNLIKPVNNTFLESSTEKSLSFYSENPEVFKHPMKMKDGSQGIIDFRIITVATDVDNDGYKRFLDSIRVYNLPLVTLGLGTKWEGGDMNRGSGGGYKINLLRDHLLNANYPPTTIILFTDSYDVILNAPAKIILEKFFSSFCSIIFSTEKNCYPDPSLALRYPQIDYPYKFLNSGGFMGTIKRILELIGKDSINNTDDDQLYLTNKYLNRQHDMIYDVKLDCRCNIFQTLQDADNDVVIDKSRSRLQNIISGEYPIIIHGNGPKGKLLLNNISNYLPNKWRDAYGYIDRTLPLESNISIYYAQLPSPYQTKDFEKLEREFLESDKTHMWVYIGINKVSEEILLKMAKRDKRVISNSDGNLAQVNDLGNRKGVWNINEIDLPYLVDKKLIQKNEIHLNANLFKNCREKGVFMFVDNMS
jgi:GR25 family glycosyltransferase involved in LPS biosynthesis